MAEERFKTQINKEFRAIFNLISESKIQGYSWWKLHRLPYDPVI